MNIKEEFLAEKMKEMETEKQVFIGYVSLPLIETKLEDFLSDIKSFMDNSDGKEIVVKYDDGARSIYFYKLYALSE